MSVLKRLLCVLLTLVILVNIPGTVPKAEAVTPGVVAGTVAIGATAVVAAMLSGLGVKPGSDASAWDNLVSQVENHLTGLGYIVDGAIKVASFKPTDDPEKLKAAIAQDIVGLTAQWLSDTNVVADNYRITEVTSQYVTIDGWDFEVVCSGPYYLFNFQYLFGSKKEYRYMTGVCSSERVVLRYTHDGNPGVLSHNGSDGCYWVTNGNYSSVPLSKKPFGVPFVEGFDKAAITSLVASLLSNVDSDSNANYVDVSSVPANFTDIPAAYPSWVSSGVADAGVTYLPISVTLPGSVPIPTTPPTEATEATEPSETAPTIVTPDILEGMFGGLKGWLESILAAILAAIQAIPEKIDAFQESLTTWWSNTIADIKSWIDIKIQSIADWWTTFWADTIATVKALGLTITEFFTVTFPAWITDVKAWALALPKTITDAIAVALAAAFVPAAGYWDAKIAACMAAFPLFNSIITTGRGLGGFFSGLGSRPPVIYIDLGNSASWAIGGTQKFLDLTWYAQYKPTVDTILSGFLWLLFAWRFFLRLPGLLRGEGGTIDRLGTYFDSKNTKDGK